MTSKKERRATRSRHDSVLELFDEAGHFIIGTGRLVNFSKVGVCFSSTKKLKIGGRLRARLRLLEEGVLDVSAHIVWSSKRPSHFLYGVAFDSVKQIRG